jgi:ceramide glucosyltransferase
MPHSFLQSVAILTTLLTVAGIGYFAATLLAALAYLRSRRAPLADFAPGVSILKSLKGYDPGMIEAFRTHCRQVYAGEYELLFGVASIGDPAVAAVEKLMNEFPERSIRLIECPERLGTNGKVSTLAQLVPHAQFDFLLINDSDITVSPRYLERVMARFAPLTPEETNHQMEVGLVTALYRGRAHQTLPSRLEALGIAADFQPSILLAKILEGGLHYGLGSTLAVRREAVEKIGGLIQLKDHLADDYELGHRIDQAGYRVELCSEVVETGIPAYSWRGFLDHQLRWARTVRDARPGGYVGLIFTHGLAWALINAVLNLAVHGIGSVFGAVSLGLLGLSLLLRLALALFVGMQVLADPQTLPSLWLLPLRDVLFLGIWFAGFAGNTIVWRGDRFALKNGKLQPIGKASSGHSRTA